MAINKTRTRDASPQVKPIQNLWCLGLCLTVLAVSPGVFGTPYDEPEGKRFNRRGTTTTSSKLTKRQKSQHGRKAQALTVELSLGGKRIDKPAPENTARITIPKPLSPQQYEKLLKRVDRLEIDPNRAKPFAIRPSSAPPPTSGREQDTPFPADIQERRPSKDASGPLSIIRMSPSGDVAHSDTISITFSEPMTALTSQAQAVETIPVKIKPEVEGQWRWLGTRTLIFETDKRLPKATQFSVTVPKTWSSISGQSLPDDQRLTFTTNAPKVVQSGALFGVSKEHLKPWLYVKFDQNVVTEGVAKHVQLMGDGNTKKIKRATAAEVKTIKTSLRGFKEAEINRWIIFKPLSELKPDTAYAVSLQAGIHSLEGPRPSNRSYDFRFRTYPPLKVLSVRCGYRNTCLSSSSVVVELSNPIESDGFKSDQISIRPRVEGLDVYVRDDRLVLSGSFQSGKNYRLTVAKSVKDIYSQRLKKPFTHRFKVSAAKPRVQLPGRSMVVLDPMAKGLFSIFSLNLETIEYELFKVGPDDWTAYKAYMKTNRRRRTNAQMPGTSLGTMYAPVRGPVGVLRETSIALKPALDDGYGQLVLRVRHPQRDHRNRPLDEYRWIQVTNIGIDVAYDHEQVMVWTNRLNDGRPHQNAEVNVRPAGQTGRSDVNGLVFLSLPEHRMQSGFIQVKVGKDIAFIPESPSYWHKQSSWIKRPQYSSYRWHHLTDRHLYRPGEVVKTKGWIRLQKPGPKGDIEMPSMDENTIEYRVVGPRGNALGKGQATLNQWGGFQFEFKLSKAANLGLARIHLERQSPSSQIKNKVHTTSFQIEEFRRPEYDVSSDIPTGPFYLNDPVDMTAKAKYFAGGALSGAAVNWRVSACTAAYRPPNTTGFSFGRWNPWWKRNQTQRCPWHGQQNGQTDSMGFNTISVKLASSKIPQPITMTAEATIVDINRQAWTTERSWVVHPSAHYVGIKNDRTVAALGSEVPIELIVTDVDGQRVDGRPITARATHIKWARDGQRWVQKDGSIQNCTVISQLKTQRCTFKAKEGGRYRIDATTVDTMGRRNISTRYVWVPGGQQIPQRTLNKDAVTLIPSKQTYQPGEAATIMVVSPFWPADGVATYRRKGLMKSIHFRMDSSNHSLKIPIDTALFPDFTLHVHLAGQVERWDRSGSKKSRVATRPAYGSGQIKINVDTRSRTLKVVAEPESRALPPGGRTRVMVSVKDHDGRPVAGAEVAILVVDEAILALAGHSFESPIKSFYKPNAAGVSDLSSRDYVLLANPEFNRADGREKPHPRGMGRKSKIGKRTKVYTFDDALVPAATALASDEPLAEAVAQRGKTTVRHRFDALALFAGSIPTDETGQAQVSVSMPDSLTRYRIVAYAVSSPNQFGLAESTITVRQPLMVRPSPPRFLNFGDKAHFPVVIQNLTDKDLSTHVALDVRNLKITGPAGHVVTVPAKDRIEVLFAIDTVSPGKAAYQVVTAAGPHSDAQTGQFPVWTPATTEAFATYGVIDSGHSVHQLKLPTDIIGQYGGLKVSTSSTALQELTDAFIYLVNYRFSCSEQIASRILSIAAMKDVLGAFNTDTLPSADTLAVTMATNFKWLASRQAADGGIPFWRPGGRTWPFLTVHVAHAVAMAQTKGYQVPSTLRKKLLRYLSRIDAHMPSQYKAQTRQVIKSYALYVLHLLGRNTVADSDMLITSIGLDKLPLTSLGFLLPILSRDDATASQRKRIVNYLYGKLSETAGRANFVSSTSDSDYLTLHSKRRLDAILLNALIASEPTSDAIPKLVRGLLSQRTRGRWGNTQENVFVLLALDRYFQAYEKSGPNFVAKVWVGDGLAGKHTFNTRSAVTENVAVPMDYLHRLSGVQPITLTKKGTGRLYYRLALNYAPKNLSLGPVNHGFVVSRRYEPMDHPDDVRLANDGTWRIKAGSRVRVRLSMFAKSRRYHVALVDPLPGGLETTNLALDGQSKSQQHESSIERIHGGWRRTWYAHQNLRDERVEAFTSMLWAGGYEYTYVARATTPGQFIAAPPKAEEMYNPETYGRGQTDRVIIE